MLTATRMQITWGAGGGVRAFRVGGGGGGGRPIGGLCIGRELESSKRK